MDVPGFTVGVDLLEGPRLDGVGAGSVVSPRVCGVAGVLRLMGCVLSLPGGAGGWLDLLAAGGVFGVYTGGGRSTPCAALAAGAPGFYLFLKLQFQV